jgi:16S rRNA (adenine1518-N6/adenine1519-N6)-dimethyltransferase
MTPEKAFISFLLIVVSFASLVNPFSQTRHPRRSYVRRNVVPLPSFLDGKTPKLGFKPKQSLGQNYLNDQNYVLKICNAIVEGNKKVKTSIEELISIKQGSRVVELGPGTGALSRVLVTRYPNMIAIELDKRAMSTLKTTLPDLTVLESDVLQVDYWELAKIRGGPLLVVGNLPYYITSQILFTFVDCSPSVRRAVVTMQWEVALRMVARPSTKDYGILSVVFQLYANTTLNFKIPPTCFYPSPKVDSALCTIDFPPTREQFPVSEADLRRVITTSFQQRRKTLRNSLHGLLSEQGVELDDGFGLKRPEELLPREFIDLTLVIFGPKQNRPPDKSKVWRHGKHGDW